MGSNPNTYSRQPRTGRDVCKLMRDINALEKAAGGTGELRTVFDISDFVSVIGNFDLVGSAQQLMTFVRLTGQVQNTKGGLWYKNRVRVKEGFKCTFTFRFVEQYTGLGADGFSFIVQNKAPAYLQGDGGDLGAYFDNRMAFEFDNYYNAHLNDPIPGGYNHVGAYITPAGTFQRVNHTNALMTKVINSPDFNTGDTVVEIAYDGATLQTTFLAGSVPAVPAVSMDIAGTMTLENGAYAYIGFNAACGTAYHCNQAHWIKSWKMEQAGSCEQTEWLAYLRNGTTQSLGTPDGGVSIPALDALDRGTLNAQLEPNHIIDMRDAVETLAEYYGYDWTDASATNLYFSAMGDRTKYGATGGAKYDWTRTREQMLLTPTYDIDIGEIYECVAVLKAAAGL